MDLHAMVSPWLSRKNRNTLEEFEMKEPKFSKQVERRLRTFLSNQDKAVHVDFRPEGANTRTKAAKLHGPRLFQFEGSESIGYVFTADEWLDAGGDAGCRGAELTSRGAVLTSASKRASM